jgi:hypothetical protein
LTRARKFNCDEGASLFGTRLGMRCFGRYCSGAVVWLALVPIFGGVFIADVPFCMAMGNVATGMSALRMLFRQRLEENECEDGFAEIGRRDIDVVHSAALRQVRGGEGEDNCISMRWEMRLKHFSTSGQPALWQECFYQFSLTANEERAKIFEPLTSRDFGVRVEPVCQGRDFA